MYEETFNHYKDDCSQYVLEHKLKISKLYNLIVLGMTNKVKRIIFKKVEGKDDSNLEKYEDEFGYLRASGVANVTHVVSGPAFSINESISKKLVKLYYNDV